MAEQAELIRKAQVIGEDEFVRFLEVRPNVYVYDLTERGKALEEEHTALYRQDMKIAGLHCSHRGTSLNPARSRNVCCYLYCAVPCAERVFHLTRSEILEPVIFDLQNSGLTISSALGSSRLLAWK